MKTLLGLNPEAAAASHQRVVLVNASPTRPLLFQGEPTSLLYAAAPLMDALDAGRLVGLPREAVALMNPSTLLGRWEGAFRSFLAARPVRLLGVSTTTAGCVVARRMASIAKEVNPRIAVVLGGPHEDDLATEASSAVAFPGVVDFSVRGDGEYMLLRLTELALAQDRLSVVQLKEQIAGDYAFLNGCRGQGCLVFVVDGHVVVREVQSSLDVDTLPRLPRELVTEEASTGFSVFRRAGRAVKTAQIMTERGCPWNCTFCSESTKARAQRHHYYSLGGSRGHHCRSASSVLAEIDEVLSFSAYARARFDFERADYSAVFFDDSTFTHRFNGRTDFLGELFLGLRALRRRREFEWGCQTRLDCLDETLLDEMVDAGCTYMYLGLESTADPLLKQMAKGMRREQIAECFDAIRQVNRTYRGVLRIGLSLLFGVPNPRTGLTDEDPSSVIETLQFVESLAGDGAVTLVSPNVAVYYPGTLMTRLSRQSFDFHYSSGSPPNAGYPWNRFEEGDGHHAPNLSPELGDFIVREAVERIGETLIDQDLYNIEAVYERYLDGTLPGRVVDLNHASLMRPAPIVVHRCRNLASNAALGREFNETARLFDEVRDRAAGIVGGCEPDGVVLTRNCTEACHLALWLAALIFGEPVDQVLLTDVENYSVRRACRFLADHANVDGRYRWASYPTFGRAAYCLTWRGTEPLETKVTVAQIWKHLDDAEDIIIEAAQRTQPEVVLFSHVERTTGRILDVRRVARTIKEHRPQTLIIVDGAKALGALPALDLPTLGADFYVGGPHFTLGSLPMGLLYMSRALVGLLRTARLPAPMREFSDVLPGMFHESLNITPSVGSSLYYPDFASFPAALDVLTREGLVDGNDFSSLDHMRRRLKQRLQEQLSCLEACEVVSPTDSGWTNFILSFRLAHRDMRTLVETLWVEHQVFLSYIARPDLIRTAFSATNTDEDVDQASEALRHLLRTQG